MVSATDDANEVLEEPGQAAYARRMAYKFRELDAIMKDGASHGPSEW